MGKENFLVNEELKEIIIDDEIFKYKPSTAGDELDWASDYLEDEIITKDGKEVYQKKTNIGKFATCKLRNIVEVPFSIEELKKITGLDKPFSQYLPKEKDLLFRKITGTIHNKLINEIDKINESKKKE
jgi:hypothetical protein